MNKKISVFICICLLLVTFSLRAEIVTRAAFDFGSGKVKLQVATVDTDKHTIVQSIHSEAIVVQLAEDIIKNPLGFSDEIQEQAIAAAQYLKQKAIELGAVEFIGLATEAYRKAPNGQALVDRYMSELSIPVRIISQIEEGKMGFLALIAETNFDPSKVVSWDIGGGSTQVTYVDDDNNIQVYMAPFGRVTTKNAIIQFVKGKDPSIVSSPNPISNKEWKNAVHYLKSELPKVPKGLICKLKKEDVKCIGIGNHPEQLRSLKAYFVDDVTKVLKERLNKSDEELAKIHSAPVSAVSELVLVYSVMNKLNITSVNYNRTSSGSTTAILISEEYWNELLPSK